MKSRLDLGDIQGNILIGYRMPVARYIFMHVPNAEAGRQFLARLLPHVTTALPWKSADDQIIKPEATVNVGMTHAGLAALGLPRRALETFPPAFREGMRARADVLHDVGKNAPAHWDWKKDWNSANQQKDVHLWVSINAMSTKSERTDVDEHRRIRDEKYERIRELLTNSTDGPEILGHQDAELPPTGTEHFGYRDGISDPHIDGHPRPRGTRIGKLTPEGNWEGLAPGEFLLGHPDEGLETLDGPFPLLLARNSTYLVYRKMHQNVGAFRSLLERAASEGFPGGPEMFAAKMVGRWRDGSPLATCPDAPDPTGQAVANNDFDYSDDPDGINVPLGSHIRRMNPRNSLGFSGKIANRHRIVRRGLPYGETPKPGEENDSVKEHGIIFMAINADLERQFEFVQREWVNHGNDFYQGNDRDPICGTRNLPSGDQPVRNQMVIPGDPKNSNERWTWIAADLPALVEVRGGDYFFLPSMTALRMIAGGTVEPD